MKNIKNTIKRILPDPAQFFIKKYILLMGLRSRMDYRKRQKLDFFDYEKIIAPAINFVVGFCQNTSYGNDRAIQNFDPNYNPHNSTIEHGLYFGRTALQFDLITGVETIYTYSQYREESIRNSNFPSSKSVRIVKVGPYIKYADNFYSLSKLKAIKKKLGKILLVFPSHSIEYIHANFDKYLFIDKINDVAKNYDTVLINVYCKDINLGLHQQYIDNGFTVVSAGDSGDRLFLSRLKDLIDLSDMTMSNNVGTHIGYCICLGKPHYIFHQEVKHHKTKIDAWVKENGERDEVAYERELEAEKHELISTFSSFEERITSEQIQVVKKYWGEFY